MTLDQLALEVAEGMLWQKVPATIDIQLFAQRLIKRLESEPPVGWMRGDGKLFSVGAHKRFGSGSIPLYTRPSLNRAVIENVVEDLVSYSATGYWNTDHIDNVITALKALLGDEK